LAGTSHFSIVLFLNYLGLRFRSTKPDHPLEIVLFLNYLILGPCTVGRAGGEIVGQSTFSG